jgi:hypothetical protein
MPIGLMMSLAMHRDAMNSFSRMDDEQQSAVIRFVQDASTGEDAKRRISEAVNRLDNGDTGPFL